MCMPPIVWRLIHDNQIIVMHTIGGMAASRYKGVVDAMAADIRAGRAPAGHTPADAPSARRHRGACLRDRVAGLRRARGHGPGQRRAGRGTFVRETSLPPRHGIDQRASPADVVDLNFNYPSLPGQADLLAPRTARARIRG